MQSTRQEILSILREEKQATVEDLAERLELTPMTIRHHLNVLQAQNLVVASKVRRSKKVGRPRLVYYLSEKGMERFPTRYLRLTNRLLDQVKESLPKQTANDLFVSMAKELASGYAGKVDSLSMEEKLEAVKELLSQEGFSVDWEKQDDKYLIHEITCPYYHIGQSHPEVCAVDQTLISTVLSIPVEKINCVLSGDKLCTYVIHDQQIMEKAK